MNNKLVDIYTLYLLVSAIWIKISDIYFHFV